MKAFLAIVKQTIRSATRSKVFHVLFFFIILGVFLLPTTVSGDGTASGLVQITLTYSLNVVVALISTTTLWLSCSLLSREIEAYNIHLVVSKPCPRWKIWLGKWFGVVVMHGVILAISAVIIYGLTMWRVSHGNFTPGELERLKREVLVGRRSFRPVLPDFTKDAEKDYERRLSEFPEDHDPEVTKGDIMRQMMATYGSVKPGEQKEWTFRNVKLSSDQEDIFLRYRMFSGDTKDTNQKLIPCIWGFKLPPLASQTPDPFVMKAYSVAGGTYQEFSISEFLTGQMGPLPVTATVKVNGEEQQREGYIPVPAAFTIDKDKDNSLVVRFANLPPEAWGGIEPATAVFQIADGPMILTKVTGFAANYCRTMLLALFQIAFLAALGCTVGAAFSTPVAAFAAIAYLVIGLSVQMAVTAPLRNDDGSYMYKNNYEKVNHKFAQLVSVLVVSVDDLDSTADLARGALVEYKRIGYTFVTMLLMRSGLLAALGMWILSRRELGAVIRK
ncbi:MAG: ABC transporter permease [Victivallales bacterium]|nr:ABC transporter permease [Victivallales bacterium]